MRNPGTYPLYLGAVGTLLLMFEATKIQNLAVALTLALICGIAAVSFPVIALTRAIGRYRERTAPGEGASIYYSVICLIIVAVFVIAAVGERLS